MTRKPTISRDRMLEAVEASPRRVAEHDKAGWLDLFARDAVVEDPVGSAPHRKGRRARGGDDELGRFYETFIAPNEIGFEVLEDLVAGAEVVRDVRIHTKLSTGLEIAVPAYLVYELVEEGGEVRIARLAAHWELARLSAQALRSGAAGLTTMAVLGARMLRLQGVIGVLGYSQGMLAGIGRRGVRAAEALAEAASRRDHAAAASLLKRAGPCVAYPVGASLMTPAELLAALPEGARLRLERPLSAGWVTCARYELAPPGAAAPDRGVVCVHFDQPTRRIDRVRFFRSSAEA
jgi:hypothetical protein